MRKRYGLVLLASLTLSSVLLVAGPSSAAAVSSPKGKVYAGIETVDPDGSPNVIAFGEGPSPVPFMLIDYNAGNCRNEADERLPVILTGLVKVSAADGDGIRNITSVRPVRMQCTFGDRQVWMVDFEIEYNSNTDVVGQNSDWASMIRTCNGQEHPDIETIVGTSGKETLVGDSGMQIIDGRGGSDTIRGKGGHDILCGGNGNDVIKGGGGIDLLIGNDGRDKLFGEEGMDVLLGGDNPKDKKREVLDGGPSGDVLFGWEGRDYLYGRSGDDLLFGGPKADKHNGGSGWDICFDTATSTFKGCEKKAKKPAPSPIRIVGPFQPGTGQAEALIAEIRAFIADKDLNFVYEFSSDVSSAVTEDPQPDIVLFPQPGAILDVADDLVDLGGFFTNNDYLVDSFGDYLMSHATANGDELGAPIRADMKSIVWYRPDEFAAGNYEIPETYAELVALSDEMVADARTPWCTYMENEPATGWVGTDWIEDLLLGAKGPAVYDDWVDHTVPFTAAPIDKAFDRFVDMIDTPDYVLDRDDILSVGWAQSGHSMVEGHCAMVKQGSFLANIIGESLDDVATFKFPPVSATYADAVMGGGLYLTATNTSSEVEAFVRHMLKPAFGKAEMVNRSGWVMPHLEFKNSLYTDPMTKGWAKDIRSAINAGEFRFDASDLMPPEIGAVVEGGPGAFWVAIQDIINKDRTVPQALQDIEDAWPE